MGKIDYSDRVDCPACNGNEEAWSFSKYCKEHDVCVECSVPREGLGYAPWGVKVGSFMCRPCEEISRKAEVEERIAKGFEHEYTDEITCPHCGYENSDSWEREESSQDEECSECEKKYSYQRIIICEYTTEKS